MSRPTRLSWVARHLSCRVTAGDVVVTGLVLLTGLGFVVLAARTGLHIVTARSLDDLLLFLAQSSVALIVLLVARTRLAALRATHLPTRVQDIDGYRVEVHEGVEGPDRRTLRSLGGRRDFFAPWIWTFATKDERLLAQLLGALRDLGVPFATDHRDAWPPASVFVDLRERGLVTGPYKTTESWRSDVRER